MNAFDASLLHYFNSFARTSPNFDLLVGFIAEDNLLKGGIPISLLWSFWFQKEKRSNDDVFLFRERVIMSLVSCIAAIFVGRLLALTLPFRPRPMENADLHFVLPYGMDHGEISKWSSFPSDHATFIFSLAMGIWLISRGVGIATFLYVTLIVALPRIYLGLHHPTDILAGAAIGMLITWLGQTEKARTIVAKPMLAWSEKSPALFYMLFFLSTYEIACMFDDVRALGSTAFHILKHMS